MTLQARHGDVVKVLLGTILVMPMLQVMPTPLGPPSAPANLIILGLWWVLSKQRRAGLSNEEPLPLKGAFLLWLAVVVVALLMRTWRQYVLGETMVNTDYDAWRAAWNAYMPLVIFILIFRIVREAKHLLAVLVAVYLSMSGEALLAWYERLQGAGRATAHLADPNRAGVYYAMALPFFVALFLSRPGRIRWLYLTICVIQVGAIFATLSRGAMLAGGAATILVVTLFFIMSKGKSGGKMLLIVSVVVLANTWQFLVPKSVEERVLFTIGGKENIGKEVDEEEMDGAAKGRLHLWRVARELAWERPWGYGAYTSLTEMQTKLGYVKATHNMYLSLLLDMGIQGLVALLIFVASVYRRLWSMYRHATSDMIRDLGLGLMGALTAGLVAVFFQDTLFRIEVSGQFWLLMAAGLAVQRQAVLVKPAARSSHLRTSSWQPASPRAAG